ncbi:MAG TPA: nitrogen regulation protein NR(II) [Burkholderiales bacterium]|nr:nitrogen regulation protein NR(II) [Burkholderiales bacterium]
MLNTLAWRALDALATAVLYLNRAAVIEYANAAAENLLKLSSKNIVGHKLEEVFLDASALLSGLAYAKAHNCSYSQHDLILATATSERLEVTCTLSPVDAAEFEGYFLELIETHQQLRIAREERLHEQTEASRALIRSLAHEIKNPLGGLRGAAQLLERELDRPELTEYTQVIMNEADRLQSLMDRLLTPSRIPQPAPLNVMETLERVRSLLLAEYPDGLRIQRDYDVSLPPILADKEQIIQALLNIARNAAQAMKGRGEIVFRTRVARQVTLARKLHRLGVMVQIIDNGPGIPEALREKIFFPLVSGREGGTGLGLTIAQNFVDQHGGLIEVQSEPGRTCFTILLPLAPQSASGEQGGTSNRKQNPNEP